MKLEVQVTSTKTLKPGEKIELRATPQGPIHVTGKKSFLLTTPVVRFAINRNKQEIELTGWEADEAGNKKSVTIVLG